MEPPRPERDVKWDSTFIKYVKYSRFNADFESVEKGTKSSPKVIGRKILHSVIKVKNTFFCPFFDDNFSRMSFLIIVALFTNADEADQKNRKNLLYKCVLELNFGTINGLGEPSF
jgi:hypothetical protein